MPVITRPRVYRVVREMLPQERFGPRELLQWLKESQLRNERAAALTPTAGPLCTHPGLSHLELSL